VQRLVPLFGLLLAGCAEQAFSAHSRDNNAEDVHRALQLSRAPQKGPQSGAGPMIFAVTLGAPAERQIVGIDLKSGQVSWKQPADVRSRIAVGHGIVAHRQGEHDIVARDPKSGQVAFTVRLGADERFMGLALDDQHLYYVVQSSGGGRRVSYTVGVDHGGHELWRTPAQGSLGAPGARGGLVGVPFAYQNISLLDGATGHEIGRIRATDEQINFVRGLPEGLFYGGGKGIYLLDEKSIGGSRAASSYIEATLASDQIRPFYSWDGYQPAQSDYSAFDRNRLLWRAVPAQGNTGIQFEDHLAVLHSFRYLFAFDTQNGKIRWAYAHPRVDIVGSEDVGTAIVFATSDGDVGAIDETSGKPQTIAKTGLKLAGVTIDADGLHVEGQGGAEATAALRTTLEQIIWDPDARFTAVKVFATSALADLPGTETSAALIKIVRAETGMARAVQKRAGEALIARKDKGADKLLVEALAHHTDFLLNKRAVGVEVLARAAAEIGSKDAAPLIGAHLADPETPQPALRELVTALGALGGKDASKALRAFLLSYRADPMFLQDPSALTGAGTALAKMGADDRRIVAFVASEQRTLPPVAAALARALTPAKPDKAPDKAPDKPAGDKPPKPHEDIPTNHEGRE
jgi:outer membrane protein assembly factor BamB